MLSTKGPSRKGLAFSTDTPLATLPLVDCQYALIDILPASEMASELRPHCSAR